MKKVFRLIIVCIIAVICLTGILLAKNLMRSEGKVKSEVTITAVLASAEDDEIIDEAKEIISAISKRDFKALSDIANPKYGVVFSPYATVDLSASCCFTPSQIANFAEDGKKYVWGVYDGSGAPIEMTPVEFFDEFIFDADFTRCENFGVDEILRAGNSLENISEVFDTCRFVDCYMPGSDEENWQSLRLVFEEYEGKLMLSAIVHSENTI